MRDIFRNRIDAGRVLARKLTRYANQANAIVLGLPRGGVSVAFEVAKALCLPLDVFVVRKLGTPGRPEWAMGAIATGGVRVLNHEVVEGLRIPMDTIDAVTAEETRELQRRELAYRCSYSTPKVHGKTVILVDDGIATGSTVRAAICALKNQHLARLVVAVPIAACSAYRQLRPHVDELVAIITPELFVGVGEWYEDFRQTSDSEVTSLLQRARSWTTAGRIMLRSPIFSTYGSVDRKMSIRKRATQAGDGETA
jgi:putative phosphoribosyl transferase